MRLLRSSRAIKSKLSIEAFENKMVATIAKRYATTQVELKELYDVGLITYKACQLNLSEDHFDRFVGWHIQQKLLQYKQEKTKI